MCFLSGWWPTFFRFTCLNFYLYRLWRFGIVKVFMFLADVILSLSCCHLLSRKKCLLKRSASHIMSKRAQRRPTHSSLSSVRCLDRALLERYVTSNWLWSMISYKFDWLLEMYELVEFLFFHLYQVSNFLVHGKQGPVLLLLFKIIITHRW